ncbi:MAG: O-antigen ligase family protein [Alishewanella agri]|nr:O-antigen ligase family protein [Alishewanella agri]
MNWHSRLPLPVASLLDRTILLLATLFVAIDWLNGALRYLLPHSVPVSAAFKALLFALLFWRGWQLCRREVQLPLLLMLLMLPGPLYIKWLTGHPYLVADLQLIAKAGAMLLAFAYFSVQAQQRGSDFLRWVDFLMLGAFALVLVNAALGLAGYGGTAYQPMDEVSQKFLGVKGFFISTNELSALLLVLSGWLFCRSWQLCRWAYPLLGMAAIFIAALLLTKTGLFGILLLLAGIPLLLLRGEQWRAAKIYLLGILGILLVLTVVLLLNWRQLLQVIGLYDKLMFAYEQRGLAGILLSSRDFYLQRNFTLVAEQYPHWLQLFGVGQGGVKLWLKKYFIELDFFDLLLFYGLAGAMLFALSFVRLFKALFSRLTQSPLVKPLLLLNVILFTVAMLAGHVLTSGMLWLPWALVNAAIFVDWPQRQSEQAVPLEHA